MRQSFFTILTYSRVILEKMRDISSVNGRRLKGHGEIKNPGC